MACFVVPAAEAVITTLVTKRMEKSEKKAESGDETVGTPGKLPFSRKLKWLNNLLWGGSAMLAFEHLWHGEISPFFPFLTAAGDPGEAMEMLKEMSTAGVGMAVLVTGVWLGMVGIASAIEKRAAKAPREEAASEAQE